MYDMVDSVLDVTSEGGGVSGEQRLGSDVHRRIVMRRPTSPRVWGRFAVSTAWQSMAMLLGFYAGV